jgi:hypothetical protein
MIASLESIADKIRSGDYETASRALESSKGTDDAQNEVMFLRGYLKMTYDREGATVYI